MVDIAPRVAQTSRCGSQLLCTPLRQGTSGSVVGLLRGGSSDGKHWRAADGRRLFTAEFKREQLARLERQQRTLAELSRDLTISPSVVRRWHRLSTARSTGAVAVNEDLVTAGELRLTLARIKELERALR